MNKALLIGVNEYASQTSLGGCVDDVVDLARLLRGRAVDVIVLTDKHATKHAIVAELAAMVAALRAGERGYFHFSGHGVRMASRRGLGMDEVLCPHDFSWTRDTAIADHELIEILERLDPDARLIVTIDACYSGDFLRGFGLHGYPRTLTSPEGMTARGPTMRGFRAAAQAPNVTFVSACSSWETATDTSFDGRPNGAFTYYLATALDAYGDCATIAEVVTAIAEPLRADMMTPVAENADIRYFSAPRTFASPLRRILPMMDDVVAFERQWQTSLLDQPLDIDVRIVAANDELVGFVVAGVFGSTLTSSPIRIMENLVFPIELGFFGIQIVLAISAWSPTGIDFELQLDLESQLPFVPRVRIAHEPVHVDVARLATPCALIPRQTQPSPLRALPWISPSGPSVPRACQRKTDSP